MNEGKITCSKTDSFYVITRRHSVMDYTEPWGIDVLAEYIGVDTNEWDEDITFAARFESEAEAQEWLSDFVRENPKLAYRLLKGGAYIMRVEAAIQYEQCGSCYQFMEKAKKAAKGKEAD